MVETSGNWVPTDPACTSSLFSIYTFAFPRTPEPQNPTLVLTIAADRDVPDKVTPELARQIFSSVRTI